MALDKLTEQEQAVVTAFYNLPLKSFSDGKVFQRLQQVQHERFDAWYNSTDRVKHLEAEEAARVRRRERDAERAVERRIWAKDNIREGMIIKVGGTRDGQGLREVMSVESNHIVCRQLCTSYGQKPMDAPIRVFGKKENHIIGLNYADQMTTHGYDKVVAYGVLSKHANGSAGYTMKRVP